MKRQELIAILEKFPDVEDIEFHVRSNNFNYGGITGHRMTIEHLESHLLSQPARDVKKLTLMLGHELTAGGRD